MHPQTTPDWMIEQGFSKTLAERFWKRVDKTDGCWTWTGQSNNKGYGLIYARGRDQKILASRISLMLHNGPIREGLCALHKCDNPICVNPNHLFLGTKLDNTRDMLTKGRHHPATKLDKACLMLIRSTAGLVSQSVIAEMLNIHQCHVSRVIAGKRRSTVRAH